MKKNMIITIVLGVLVLISIVQAIQLNGLKDKISTGSVSTGSGSGSTVAAAGNAPAESRQTASLPKSLDNLPQMVGGC